MLSIKADYGSPKVEISMELDPLTLQGMWSKQQATVANDFIRKTRLSEGRVDS